MRVDFEVILERLNKAGDKAAKLRERIAKIADLEEYTLLLPPYNAKRVKELILAAQHPEMLAFRFPAAYVNFMQCCDGGRLFTDQLFSLDDAEDEDNDLITANFDLRDAEAIPEGTVAIGVTNYGAYIVIRPDGTMGLWDMDEEAYNDEYDDLYAWLDEMLAIAQSMIEHGTLRVIEDDDDADDDDDEDDGAEEDEDV